MLNDTKQEQCIKTEVGDVSYWINDKGELSNNPEPVLTISEENYKKVFKTEKGTLFPTFLIKIINALFGRNNKDNSIKIPLKMIRNKDNKKIDFEIEEKFLKEKEINLDGKNTTIASCFFDGNKVNAQECALVRIGDINEKYFTGLEKNLKTGEQKYDRGFGKTYDEINTEKIYKETISTKFGKTYIMEEPETKKYKVYQVFNEDLLQKATYEEREKEGIKDTDKIMMKDGVSHEKIINEIKTTQTAIDGDINADMAKKMNLKGNSLKYVNRNEIKGEDKGEDVTYLRAINGELYKQIATSGDDIVAQSRDGSRYVKLNKGKSDVENEIPEYYVSNISSDGIYIENKEEGSKLYFNDKVVTINGEHEDEKGLLRNIANGQAANGMEINYTDGMKITCNEKKSEIGYNGETKICDSKDFYKEAMDVRWEKKPLININDITFAKALGR